MSYSKTEVRKNVNRLLALADFLENKAGQADFDMSTWAQFKDGRTQDHINSWDGNVTQEPVPVTKAVHCKTACCIGGWATNFHPDLILDEYGGLIHLPGTCQEAFAHPFGIDEDIASRLTFIGAPHQTPKAAAKAVERVARNLAERHGYTIE